MGVAAAVDQGDEAADVEIEGAPPGVSFVGNGPDLHEFGGGAGDVRADDGEGRGRILGGRICGIGGDIGDIFKGVIPTRLGGGEAEVCELVIPDAEGSADAPRAKAEDGEKGNQVGLRVVGGVPEFCDDGRDVHEEVATCGGAVGLVAEGGAVVVVGIGAGHGEVGLFNRKLAEIGDEAFGFEEMVDGVEIEGQPCRAEENGGEEDQPAGPFHGRDSKGRRRRVVGEPAST